jgi:hypothetical protein
LQRFLQDTRATVPGDHSQKNDRHHSQRQQVQREQH